MKQLCFVNIYSPDNSNYFDAQRNEQECKALTILAKVEMMIRSNHILSMNSTYSISKRILEVA